MSIVTHDEYKWAIDDSVIQRVYNSLLDTIEFNI